MGILDRFRKKNKSLPIEAEKTLPKELEIVKKHIVENRNDELPLNKAEGGNRYSFVVLKRPHVSEKAAHNTEHETYVFDVAISAEKIAIKKAVEALYRVNVRSVRTIRNRGKMIRRGRIQGRRNNCKKAFVTLKPGQKIDLYEGV